jgi:ATP-dependent Clp protease ATP-binding subunit ClpC
MALANQEAQRFNHEYIGTEHILLGLVKEGSGVGANVLKNLDVDLRKVRLEVEKLVKSGPDMVTMGKLPQTPRAKKVIEYAIEEARNLNHNYVGTEHLLLGLLREHDGVAAQVLMNLSLKLDEVREEVLNLLGAGTESEDVPGGGGAPAGEAQGRQGQEQDARARLVRPRSDRVGPGGPASSTRSSGGRARSNAWCRSSAAAPRTTRCCSARPAWARPRSSKGWPAHHRNDVPELLATIAHRRARPGDDGRRHQVPRPVRGAHQGGDERGAPAKNVILFIDELHTLVGAGGAEGAIDASQRAQAGPLARRDPVHRRDDASTSTASTSRRTRPRTPLPGDPVEPPSDGGDRRDPQGPARQATRPPPREITDEALAGRGRALGRYITGRVQPDKSIDVIDEAGARVRLKSDDQAAEPGGDRERHRTLNAEKDEAVKNADYEKAAELRDKAEPAEKKKEEIQKQWRDKMKEVDGVVDEEVIAEVVSQDDRRAADRSRRRRPNACSSSRRSCTRRSSARTRRSSDRRAIRRRAAA